ncbi:MAG TPA: SCO family protein [Pyrinomonadaceae bacterium]|nr:SCO family protein [Pyrinomonadaceae bacterium]
MISKTILTTLLLLVIGAGPAFDSDAPPSALAQTPAKQQKAAKKIKRYACPMHPEVNSPRKGKCPKCGMSLRLVEEPPPGSVPSPSPIASDSSTIASDQSSSMSSVRIPDVEVFDQNGRRLKFRSDLIKDKTVAINFIFTTCTAICPPLTATFRRVQQEAIAQKLPVQLISISVDPTTDTPERLREFAAKFKAEPGWTFVTGDKAAIDSILQALGTAVAVKTDHTPMVLIGNERKDYWTRMYGLSSPTSLVKLISQAANK